MIIGIIGGALSGLLISLLSVYWCNVKKEKCFSKIIISFLGLNIFALELVLSFMAPFLGLMLFIALKEDMLEGSLARQFVLSAYLTEVTVILSLWKIIFTFIGKRKEINLQENKVSASSSDKQKEISSNKIPIRRGYFILFYFLTLGLSVFSLLCVLIFFDKASVLSVNDRLNPLSMMQVSSIFLYRSLFLTLLSGISFCLFVSKLDKSIVMEKSTSPTKKLTNILIIFFLTWVLSFCLFGLVLVILMPQAIHLLNLVKTFAFLTGLYDSLRAVILVVILIEARKIKWTPFVV